MFKIYFVGLIKSFVLNNKIPDKVFIFYFNRILRKRKLNSIVEANKIKPYYSIKNLETGQQKYFCYKKLGLICFEFGISARGSMIGQAYMLDLILFQNDDIVLDVGANTGDLKIYFENKSIAINYYGFEPGLNEFKALNKNLESDAYNIALGKSDGTMDFYYKPENGDSSLVEMESFIFKYKVDVKRLATVIHELNLDNKIIKLLKIEAEGYEPEVVEGIGPFLNNIKYISADLGFERGLKSECTIKDVLNQLIPKGFKIVAINEKRMVFLLENQNL